MASVAVKSRERHGGPPYFWIAEVASPAAGTWQAKLARDGAPAECSTITREIAVRDRRAAAAARDRRAASGRCATPGIARTENLYSAWIEKLFDAPLDATLSWPALHEVLRDRSRNILFNHLGLGEDQMGHDHSPRLRRPSLFPARLFRVQDGAAVRLLEVHARRRRRSRRDATRGGTSRTRSRVRLRRPSRTPLPARRCEMFRRSGQPSAGRRQPAAERRRLAVAKPPGTAAAAARGSRRRFGHYLRYSVADGVHSGSGRTARNDDNTDYYPVPLTEDTLRPGTVYADPYGHLLVLAQRVPQTRRRSGRLPRRRRAARRHGRAQALLARQLPVRAGSRARRPGLQALPADRARQERRACGG